jgi:hypothetical protein
MSTSDDTIAYAAGVAAAASADVGLVLAPVAFAKGFLGAVTGTAKTQTYLLIGAAALGAWLLLRKVL